MSFKNKKSSAQSLLDHVSQFRSENIKSRGSLKTTESKTGVDEMIVNLGNPRLAEKMRINQMVEAQFDKIEKEVRLEVKKRLNKTKEERSIKAKTTSDTGLKALTKAAEFRKEETKRKLKFSKQNESTVAPTLSSKSVSFREHIDMQKENIPEVKFEVLEKKFHSTGKPLVISKSEKSKQNMGVYEMKQRNYLNEKKIPHLSSHILPSVNIRLRTIDH